MTQQKWIELREWLTRIFGPDEGEAMFAEHVAEARAAGLELPNDVIIYAR